MKIFKILMAIAVVALSITSLVVSSNSSLRSMVNANVEALTVNEDLSGGEEGGGDLPYYLGGPQLSFTKDCTIIKYNPLTGKYTTTTDKRSGYTCGQENSTCCTPHFPC